MSFFSSVFESRALQEDGSITNIHDYVVVPVVCFFSIFFTLGASYLGYYTWRENRLLRDYLRNGIVLDSYILSQEYVREIPGIGAEYSVTCEYEQQKDDQPTMRVRKQVRVHGNDLFLKPISYAKLSKTQVVVGKNKNYTSAVKLFVLPGFPLSGYPCNAAQRAMTARHQISTMALILALFCVSFFCVFTFEGFVEDMLHLNENKSVWLSIILISLLTLVEITMIHLCFRSKVDAVLSQEYKLSGEYDFPYEQ